MSRRSVFWPIYLSVGISYLGVGLVAPLISIFLAEHGVDTFVVGLVGTTMFAAFTLATFPIGAAADHIGPKRLLVGGLCLYGVSILLFALIRDPWLFFVIRAVEGVGGAAISVSTETAINQLSGPEERGKRMSYYGLCVGLGWALGPLAGTSLFGVRAWLPFLGCFGLSLAAALLVARFLPSSVRPDHHAKGIFRELSREMIAPISSGAIYGYMMSSLITLFPLYLNKIGIAEVVMGTIITGVIIGTIVSQIPIGWAADRFGKRRLLFACSLTLSVLFLLLSLRTEWWYFVVIGVMLGSVAGSLYPVGLALLGSIVNPARLGAATALFSLAFGIGCLTGPTVSGLAMKHAGNDKWLFYIPSMLSVTFAVELALLSRRIGKRRHEVQDRDQISM